MGIPSNAKASLWLTSLLGCSRRGPKGQRDGWRIALQGLSSPSRAGAGLGWGVQRWADGHGCHLEWTRPSRVPGRGRAALSLSCPQVT